MNERITIVSDTEVRLRYNAAGGIYEMRLVGGKIYCDWVKWKENYFDADGARAEKECINCWLDTGTFAALADTSKELFVGKKMLSRNTEVSVVALPIKRVCSVLCSDGVVCSINTEHLLPLAPPKKVRPYTFAEAAAVLKEHAMHRDHAWIKHSNGDVYSITGLELDGSSMITEHGVAVPLDAAAADYVWTDDLSPCGVEE